MLVTSGSERVKMLISEEVIMELKNHWFHLSEIIL